MQLGKIAGSVGRGLAAGLVGTVAMTLSSTLEMRLRGRESSDTPAKALERVLKVVPEGDIGQQRLAQVGHYGYGTMWGGVRGLIAGLGVPRVPGAALHGAIVWGGEQLVLPSLDLSPPAWRWRTTEVVVDLWHHLVFVLATDAAFAYLNRQQ